MSSQYLEVAVSEDQMWRYGYWVALAVAGILLLVGLANGNHNLAIAACFVGIVSRILQAEYHFRLQAKTRIPREP